MRRYIIRRLLLLIPTFWLASTFLFAFMRYLPGDAAIIMASSISRTGETTPQIVQELREHLGLAKPIHEQYLEFYWNLARGDLGTSIWTRLPVIDEMRPRLPISLQLILMAVVIGWTWGIVVGIIAALKQDRPIDYIFRSVAIGGLSIPVFWTGILIIVIPAILWGVTPYRKFVPLFVDPIANLQLMIFPAVILGIHLGAPVMRLARTTMLEVFRQDYVRTAYAKGLAQKVVVLRHVLRNALIPVVTIMGLQVIGGISGSVILEALFGIPGMGKLLVQEALAKRDYPMIQGLNIMMIFMVVSINLIVDLSYGLIDPRIRYQ